MKQNLLDCCLMVDRQNTTIKKTSKDIYILHLDAINLLDWCLHKTRTNYTALGQYMCF